MQTDSKKSTSWLDRPVAAWLPGLNIEMLLVIVILLLAVASRFYHVDLRVMSHDETNHVVPAYDLFRGRGYRHDPVTHGPMQFHLLALSYFLFGDNDMSARIPAVVFSIATVAVVLFCFRRYLGRTGALMAGLFFLISPYMLFYGRYTRNEAFVGLFGVALLYGVLRYLDRGDYKALLIVTLATVCHFITKETAYIYTAQYLLFVGILFVDAVMRLYWPNERGRVAFAALIVSTLLFIGAAFIISLKQAALTKEGATQVVEGAQTLAAAGSGQLHWLLLGAGGLGVLAGIAAVVLLLMQIGWQRLCQMRSFDLLILVFTLILPQLAAFPVKMLGWDPLDYTSTGMVRTGAVLAVFLIVSVLIGLKWKPKYWLGLAAVFYSIYIVFYTTFFTNGRGFFTGIIGSLGYWLAQQGVQRGSQPWYFYALVQIPVYEYLAALGALLALYFAIRHNRFLTVPGYAPAHQPVLDAFGQPVADPLDAEPVEEPQHDVSSVRPLASQSVPLEFLTTSQMDDENTVLSEPAPQEVPAEPPSAAAAVAIPTLALLLFWSITSLVAFSIAGEKMPWLTVHITLPLLLSAGWGVGYLIDSTEWKKMDGRSGWLALLLLPVFLVSLFAALGQLLGATPPFAGKTLEQLDATSNFFFALVMFLGSGYGLYRLLHGWQASQLLRLLTTTFFALLVVLTARAAAMASYINYDNAMEFLVYAHAARGPKDVLAQVEEISRRTTKGKDIVVAYDNDALYPYWWYFRDYPNKRWFTDKPTRDLKDVPIIIAGEASYAKLEPIVKDNFVYFEYTRLWWPMQDYFGLTPSSIFTSLADPQMRQALFKIWLDRDYSEYAKLKNNQSLTLETWQPSNRMRMYIRKDMVAKIWNYGSVPAMVSAEQSDPYLKNMIALEPDQIIGGAGTAEGQFNAPRGLAVAADGSLYVADSLNNRIQHFTADGQVIKAWGTMGDVALGTAAAGTFKEPWGVAVSNDGSVYVADTWNHRVQKFSPDGESVGMWGSFGQGDRSDAFWGPRGIAVDANGQIYVTDTGNKRVVIFDKNGTFVNQMGEAGLEAGQLDEPVGVAVDAAGKVYVADTWNQRIQVFALDAAESVYRQVKSWDISGWVGQSLDNKPFIAVDASGHVFITDPEAARVLEFDSNGLFIRGWGDSGNELMGVASGIAVDNQGHVWVSDSSNHRVLRYTLPQN